MVMVVVMHGVAHRPMAPVVAAAMDRGVACPVMHDVMGGGMAVVMGGGRGAGGAERQGGGRGEGQGDGFHGFSPRFGPESPDPEARDKARPRQGCHKLTRPGLWRQAARAG